MSDDVLLTEFAEQGNESAFAALVRRHVDLVYATARRQLGDAALAEEVTQNVFIVLARKSGRLRGSATISGWLYRTTLLEARQALRAELRRQRRETIAFELTDAARKGESPWAALAPMLDEGLTRLREGDRLAVLLRFFEQQPFREVGRVLGISEDAAQKRVAKSLDELAHFFQARGFGGSKLGVGGAGIAALLAEATSAAPVPLASGVAQGALGAAGAGLSGLGWLTLNLMNITKVQLTVACLCLAAVPLAFQAQAVRGTERDFSSSSARLAAAQRLLGEIESERDALAQRRRELDLNTVRAPRLVVAAPATSPSWRDDSPFARVPKELLERLKMSALGSDWKLRTELASVLGLTPAQFDGANRALQAYLATTSALEESHLTVVPSGNPNAKGDQARITFRISRYEPEANRARLQFRERLVAETGDVRADLILRYLDFAPVNRPMAENAEEATGDYFERSGHGSDRWNFHGYERTVTVEGQGRGQPPNLSVDMKIGAQESMSFGGGMNLLNPAVAPTLKAQIEAMGALPARAR